VNDTTTITHVNKYDIPRGIVFEFVDDVEGEDEQRPE
tara:strand:- start:138 stop:248 length:111 start_codon:yes stop_codon:yes gene_type:complete